MKRWLVILFLSVIASSAQGQTAWVWSKKDLKAIASLERKVVHEGERFCVETPYWIVETEVDSRFTAELGIFLDRFKMALDELLVGLHDGPLVKQKPTVVVFDLKSDYDEKFPGGSRGLFKHHFAGDAWDQLHVYSYVARQRFSERSS